MRARSVFLITAWLMSQASPGEAQTFTDVSNLLSGRDVTVFAAGSSIIDVNADGLLDLYRFQGLYLQQSDGTFIESTQEVGLRDDEGNSIEGTTVFGAIYGDYDNDGYVDILFEDLNNFSAMFRGRGDGSFYRANDEANVEIFSVLQGSIWGDFDADGNLDLFGGGDGDPSVLFMNNGNGTFTNESPNVGYTPFKNIYGAAAADFDNDGDLDIYLSSCSGNPEMSENVFFRNDGSGNFTNIAPALGMDDDRGGWAVVWADVNNDGWLDLFVGNQRTAGSQIPTRPGFNRMYINDGMGGFTDRADEMGLAGDEFDATLGAAAADFNNDGWIDFITATNSNSGPLLHINDGGASFATSTPTELEDASNWAVSTGDVNADGWQDLWIPGFQGQKLFYNDGGAGNWLHVIARGMQSNYYGIGARIEIHAPDLVQVREITAGNGMTSQNDALGAHFGLAEHIQADSVVIRWPSGAQQVLVDVAAQQSLTIVEGVGVNHAPETFTTMFPAPDSILGAPTTVQFMWGSSDDAEGDDLSYTLKVLDESAGALSTYSTADTTMELDGNLFAGDVEYQWSVDVTDGYSITRSLNRTAFTVAIPSSIDDVPRVVARISEVTAYPNPFDGSVTVGYSLDEVSEVRYEIFDVSGRRMAFGLTGMKLAGPNSFSWDGKDLTGREVYPGVYLFRLRAGDATTTGKVVKM